MSRSTENSENCDKKKKKKRTSDRNYFQKEREILRVNTDRDISQPPRCRLQLAPLDIDISLHRYRASNWKTLTFVARARAHDPLSNAHSRKCNANAAIHNVSSSSSCAHTYARSHPHTRARETPLKGCREATRGTHHVAWWWKRNYDWSGAAWTRTSVARRKRRRSCSPGALSSSPPAARRSRPPVATFPSSFCGRCSAPFRRT